MNNPHSELTTVIITNRFDQRFWKAVKSAYWSSMLVLVDPDAEKNDLLLKKQIDTLKKKYPQIQVLIGKSKVEDFSEVRNEALSLIKTPWAFFMDSDEWMDRNLEHAILQAISSHQSLDAYKVYRQDFFLNKPLLHGEPASVALVRLGKVKGGKWQGKVHENWEFPNECGELTSFLFHEPHTSITEFIGKINV